jgi:hypothetical protein
VRTFARVNVENRISILLWSDRCNPRRHDEERSTNNEKKSREIEEKNPKMMRETRNCRERVQDLVR